MLVQISRYFTPEDLSNGIIQTIGNEYLAKYQNNQYRLNSFFHHNHELAKKLSDYQNDGPGNEKNWLWLTDIYRQLPNNCGELAKTIRKLFEIAFNQTINISKKDISFPVFVVKEKSTAQIAKRLYWLVLQYKELQYEMKLLKSFSNNNVSLL